jgi:hypothetical protein
MMAEKIRAITTADGFQIVGNRDGLLGLADICRRLASLPENSAESRQMGNHYHYAPWANNTEDDSIEFTILYSPEL